jgi:hypothetical protein
LASVTEGKRRGQEEVGRGAAGGDQLRDGHPLENCVVQPRQVAGDQSGVRLTDAGDGRAGGVMNDLNLIDAFIRPSLTQNR